MEGIIPAFHCILCGGMQEWVTHVHILSIPILVPVLFLLLLDGQLTSALVPTVPFPCFLRQSATIAKIRETVWCVICSYPLRDQLVVVGDQRLGRSCLGRGLV